MLFPNMDPARRARIRFFAIYYANLAAWAVVPMPAWMNVAFMAAFLLSLTWFSCAHPWDRSPRSVRGLPTPDEVERRAERARKRIAKREIADIREVLKQGKTTFYRRWSYLEPETIEMLHAAGWEARAKHAGTGGGYNWRLDRVS